MIHGGYDVYQDTEKLKETIVVDQEILHVDRMENVGSLIYHHCSCYPDCKNIPHELHPRGGFLPRERFPLNSSYMADYIDPFIDETKKWFHTGAIARSTCDESGTQAHMRHKMTIER